MPEDWDSEFHDGIQRDMKEPPWGLSTAENTRIQAQRQSRVGAGLVGKHQNDWAKIAWQTNEIKNRSRS